LVVSANDAGGSPVYDTSVTFAVSGTGSATVTPNSGMTDVSGELSVTVSGTGAGTVTVAATGLGTTATQDFSVNAAGAVFGIDKAASVPAITADPASLDVSPAAQVITVNAPTQANVRFATTLGVWDGGTSSVVTKAVAAGSASASLSSTLAGLATVQAFDAADSSTSDTVTIAISSPAENAAQLTLQANPSVVAVSGGGIENTATLVATVRTSAASGSQAVGDAPVAFAIGNPTGGGEKISPAIAFTDSSGEAETTFTSGSTSSIAEGVTVDAWVVGEGATGTLANTFSFNDLDPDTITRSDGGDFSADGFEVGEQILVTGSEDNDGLYTLEAVAALTLTLIDADAVIDEAAALGITVGVTAVANSANIIIGGIAGSVVIGQGDPTSISETAYSLPMSVLVVDSAGSPVSGAQVSLSAWPVSYSAGVWYDRDPEANGIEYHPYIAGTFDNEDTDMDAVLDAGEDANKDGQLTPLNASAGAVPTAVTTDSSGLANFSLTYLKLYANWVVTRIRATALVFGTETSSSTTFRLPYILSEGNAGELSASPYVTTVAVDATAGSTELYDFPNFGLSISTDVFTTDNSNASLSAYSEGPPATNGKYSYDPLTAGDAPGDVVNDTVGIQGDAADDDGAVISGGIQAFVPIDIVIE